MGEKDIGIDDRRVKTNPIFQNSTSLINFRPLRIRYLVGISGPTCPDILGVLDLDGFANAVTVSGDFAYVSDETSGIKKIDIRNPVKPTLVAFFDTPGESADVAIHGEYIIVPDSFSLMILK